jgi:hypothetical protein
MSPQERFKKSYSHSVGRKEDAVFLDFSIVSATSQVALDMLRRQSLAKIQKSSRIKATVLFKTDQRPRIPLP